MKLSAWLRQDHSFPERLQIVERLSQTLNEIHDRGEYLAALDPDHVDVAGGGQCDVSGARRGTASPAYQAPERAEGGPPSAEADIYAAGAIAWEVLSGRPCGQTPTHLAEASPTVPRELADAVMACLEQSPQWRPRDLTYLAQLAQHAQGQRPAKSERSARATGSFSRGASARASAASSAGPLAGSMRRESRSHLPLAIVAGLVVVAAAGSYYWFTRERGETPRRPGAPTTTALSLATRPVPPTPAATIAAPAAQPTPRPTATVAATPYAVASNATPVPVAVPTPAYRPTAPPIVPTPAPATLPAGTLAPARSTMPGYPRPTLATVPPAPVTTLPVTTTTTIPPAPVSLEPVVLTALSPLSTRRPGKVVFDLRGSGLRSDLRARILAIKEIPRGITVVRQVCKSPGLFQVLVDLDATVTPGNYAIVLEQAAGDVTKGLTFTVTK